MLWLKAFHIVAVVTWFAALFYLPRLFVYHAAATDELSCERFKIMERKLYRGIMTPSMIAVLALGSGILISHPAFLHFHWLHIKLLLVILLVIYHFYCGHLVKVFATNSNQRSHIFYRWFNELPVLLLISIVILVVVKPF